MMVTKPYKKEVLPLYSFYVKKITEDERVFLQICCYGNSLVLNKLKVAKLINSVSMQLS